MSKGKMGFWTIVLFGINSIIGSGIFLLPNNAMSIIGPASLGVLLFDMLLVLAMTFALPKPAVCLKITAARTFMPKRLWQFYRLRGWLFNVDYPHYCVFYHGRWLCNCFGRHYAGIKHAANENIIVTVIFALLGNYEPVWRAAL